MTKDYILPKTNEIQGNGLQIVNYLKGRERGACPNGLGSFLWKQGLVVTSDIVNLLPKNHRVQAQVFLVTPDQVSKNVVQRPLSTERKHNC